MDVKTIAAFVGSARGWGLTYAATRQFLDGVRRSVMSRADRLLERVQPWRVPRLRTCFLWGEERRPLKDDGDVLIENLMMVWLPRIERQPATGSGAERGADVFRFQNPFRIAVFGDGEHGLADFAG